MSKRTIHPTTSEKNTYYRYDAVPELLNSEELGTYVSFAIQTVHVEETVISTVSDVSTELEEVQRLAELCTQRELDPEQLPDIIEDFLNKSDDEMLIDEETLI